MFMSIDFRSKDDRQNRKENKLCTVPRLRVPLPDITTLINRDVHPNSKNKKNLRPSVFHAALLFVVI
jgi:hypothetical protein